MALQNKMTILCTNIYIYNTPSCKMNVPPIGKCCTMVSFIKIFNANTVINECFKVLNLKHKHSTVLIATVNGDFL